MPPAASLNAFTRLKNLVSAAVGFDVTGTESLNVAAEAGVPQTVGEKTVSSMRLEQTPVYAYYSYDVYFGLSRVATGMAKRLVGACFQRSFATGLMANCSGFAPGVELGPGICKSTPGPS